MDNLKLIAVLVPDPLAGVVRQEQEFIAKTWGPKHVMRSPPHITLIPTLEVKEQEHLRLIEIGTTIASQSTPFQVELDGYGAFKPRVVFVRPLPNEFLQEQYQLWRKALSGSLPHLLIPYPDKPFKPHVTLAHRDITKEQFSGIWHYLKDKSFDASFEVKSCWMLKHDPSGWTPEIEFVFH